MTSPTVTPWPDGAPPTMAAVERAMRDEGLDPRAWSNGAGDSYGVHAHPYTKALYCVRGSIRFSLPEEGREIDLAPGDRMALPPGTRHGAVVGSAGVTCVEAPAP